MGPTQKTAARRLNKREEGVNIPNRVGPDSYLKRNSEYKRFTGRNLGDSDHGTPL